MLRPKPSSFISTVLFISISTVFAINFANAQDFNAIERRLGEAVAEGEISLEQAQIMLGALRHSNFERVREEKERHEEFRRREHGHHEHGHHEHGHHEQGHHEQGHHEQGHHEQGHHEQGHHEHGHHEHGHHEHGHHEHGHHEQGHHEHGHHESHEHHEHGRHEEHEHDERRHSLDQMTRRFAEALHNVGVEREAIRPAIEIAHKISRDMVEQGDRFELDNDMKAYMSKELKLDQRQIELVVGVAKRITRLHHARNENKMRERRRPENDDDDLEDAKREYMQFVEKIKAAVEVGDLSEADAEKKLIEMRQKMFPDK